MANLNDGSYMHNALTNLSHLMTLDDTNVDLLELVKFLAVNQFQNLESTSNLSYPCFGRFLSHYNNHENKKESHFLSEDVAFIAKSPCLDTDKFPECQTFCSWFAMATKSLSKNEILTMMR